MIEVIIQSTEGKIQSLKITGHANTAEEGKDIVCSAVSAVVTAGMNTLKDVNNFKLVYEKGHIEIEAKKDPSAHDAVVLETVVNGLKSIEESTKDVIKIFYRKV